MRYVKGQKVNVTGWTRRQFRGLSPEKLKMLMFLHSSHPQSDAGLTFKLKSFCLEPFSRGFGVDKNQAELK